MENQATLAVPTDDGLDVFTSSQWAIETQRSIGQVLGVPDNTVNVSVKRIGGGFGGKITRGNIIAAATCLAARKMRKPVRTVLDMATCMTMLGGRDPFWSTYKVGVDAEGRLQAVQATMTSNAGYVNVDPNNTVSPPSVPSCYNCPNWEITPVTVLTNTPNNTWTRTPGTTEGVTLMGDDHRARGRRS
nr:xanthine dehydrogenase/oxidase-like [Penaeus vannamei]